MKISQNLVGWYANAGKLIKPVMVRWRFALLKVLLKVVQIAIFAFVFENAANCKLNEQNCFF